MFCGKCGAQLPDGAAFCGNCGNQMGRKASVGTSGTSVKKIVVHPENKTSQEKTLQIFPGILLILAAAAVVLLVVVIRAAGHKPENASTAGESADSTVITEQSEADARQTQLTVLNANEDVFLEGEYPELEEICLSGGHILTLEVGAVFPKVKDIQCGAIVTQGYSNSLFSFDPAAFPALRSVTLSAENSQVDDTVLKTLESLYLMRDSDMLQELKVDFSHTLADLYGTWKDEQGLLAFTVQKDGSVHVAEGSGILGASLLTYEEVDDDTLRLQADGDGLWKLVNMEMDYTLLGDVMFVELAGQEFELYRD